MLSQLPSPSASLSYSEVKDSQLSPSEFLDRAILLLAARHGADPNYDLSTEEEDQQQQSARWLEVSKDMQALAKSHSCRSGQLRVVTTMVDDAEAFSVQACINRAKFAMYRLEKEEEERKEERRQQKQQQKQNQKQQSNTTMMMQNQYVDPRDPKPSGFDITKGHSIADAVNRIMEECRDKIMNISMSSTKKNNNRLLKNNNNGDGGDDDSDSDDDDDPSKPIEIYKPPEHIARSLMMSEADTRRAMELGQAEEDLINRVHNLQMDHFKKYKKWVNLGGAGDSNSNGDEEMIPASLLSDMSPETKAVLLQQHQQPSSSSSSSKPIINKMNADDVAEMLGKLNLGEHIGRFRRTSGPVLAQMTKDDIRLRFDNDHEATDILWMHLEENMTRSLSGVMKNRFSNASSSYYGDDVENNNNDENYAPRQQQRNSSKSAQQQQQRSSAAPSLGMSKESSQMKAIYDAISAPSDDLQFSQRALDEFEVGNGNDSSSSNTTSSNLREQLRQGNFGALKRTLDILEGNGGADDDGTSSRNNHADLMMNSSLSGGRPLRPSQEYKMMREMQQHNNSINSNNNDGDLNELTDNYMNTLKSKSTGAEVTSGAQNKNYGGRGGGGRGGRGGSGAVPSSSQQQQQKPAATSTTTTSAPARSGRWAIVEYDEDEDDVE